jgi:hypothetical protein
MRAGRQLGTTSRPVWGTIDRPRGSVGGHDMQTARDPVGGASPRWGRHKPGAGGERGAADGAVSEAVAFR